MRAAGSLGWWGGGPFWPGYFTVSWSDTDLISVHLPPDDPLIADSSWNVFPGSFSRDGWCGTDRLMTSNGYFLVIVASEFQSEKWSQTAKATIMRQSVALLRGKASGHPSVRPRSWPVVINLHRSRAKCREIESTLLVLECFVETL